MSTQIASRAMQLHLLAPNSQPVVVTGHGPQGEGCWVEDPPNRVRLFPRQTRDQAIRDWNDYVELCSK